MRNLHARLFACFQLPAINAGALRAHIPHCGCRDSAGNGVPIAHLACGDGMLPAASKNKDALHGVTSPYLYCSHVVVLALNMLPRIAHAAYYRCLQDRADCALCATRMRDFATQVHCTALLLQGMSNTKNGNYSVASSLAILRSHSVLLAGNRSSEFLQARMDDRPLETLVTASEENNALLIGNARPRIPHASCCKFFKDGAGCARCALAMRDFSHDVLRKRRSHMRDAFNACPT